MATRIVPEDWAPPFGAHPVWRDNLRAAGSARTLGEAASASRTWIASIVGSDAVVAVARPDAAGRLRVVWCDGGRIEVSRTRSDLRREVFASGQAEVFRGTFGTRSLAMVPLGCRGDMLGVLEVLAGADAIEAAWEGVEEVGDHLSMALWNVTERTGLQVEAANMERVARLAAALISAPTREAAVRVALRFVSERFDAPVAAWSGPMQGSLTLIGVRGLASGRRRAIRETMGVIPTWRSLPPREQRHLIRRLGRLMARQEVAVIDAGDALILVGDPRARTDASLSVVGPVLEGALRNLEVTQQARRRNWELDLSLAWTAHELRSPLLGVNAALQVLLNDQHAREDREIVTRSMVELERLSGLVGGLLRWAVGVDGLRLRRADLARVIREAVDSCSFEFGTHRVTVNGPRSLVATIDVAELKAAIVNVVRNALAYSPSGTTVQVSIRADDATATVIVRDEGPGIPATERESVFDPFVRGRSVRVANGSGLGLFIARRIVEAHEGTIRLEPGNSGATFVIDLPLPAGGSGSNRPRIEASDVNRELAVVGASQA